MNDQTSGIFWDALPPDARDVLRRLAAPQRFDAGTLIFREGERAPAVYVIESGEVSLEICAAGIGCRPVLTLSAGELVGWSPLLSPDCPVTATARARTDVAALAIDAGTLLRHCDADPQLGYVVMREVVRSLARRLTATRLQMLDIHEQTVTPSRRFE